MLFFLRAFVDEFLKKMGELYEWVLFTASLAKVLNSTRCQFVLLIYFSIIHFLHVIFSMLIRWPTCWTNGACSEVVCSARHVSSTVATTLR